MGRSEAPEEKREGVKAFPTYRSSLCLAGGGSGLPSAGILLAGNRGRVDGRQAAHGPNRSSPRENKRQEALRRSLQKFPVLLRPGLISGRTRPVRAIRPVAHVFLCGYGQPAVLSRAANCCPCLCMHWTDGRHVLKRDETAGRPASGASSKKDTIRLSTVEKQNSTIFFFIFLSTVEKAKA